MSKEKRGTKRLCKSCEKNFYDLGKTPIVCPVCETLFVEDKPKPKPKPKTAPAPAPEPEKAAEPTKVKEPVVEAEAVSGAEPPPPDPEFVSLEEAAAEEDVDEDAKLADLGDDDDADIPPDDNQDVFLEDDDESGPDVSVIIGTPIDPKDGA